MTNKKNVDDFNAKMAEKLGVSLQKTLIDKGVIEKGIGYNVFKDYIFRMLSYYSSIRLSDIYVNGKVDEVKEKETQIEFESFVMHLDIWEQWKRNWDYQKPLHDKDWLKAVLREEKQEYDEKSL